MDILSLDAADFSPEFHLDPPRSLRVVNLVFGLPPRPVNASFRKLWSDYTKLCDRVCWFICDSPLEVLRVTIEHGCLQLRNADCGILVDKIIENHWETMQLLELPEKMIIQRDTFKKLLRSCVNLEQLEIGIRGGRECLATFIRHAVGLHYLHTAHLHCENLKLEASHERWLVACNAKEIMKTVKGLRSFSVNKNVHAVRLYHCV
ncbi:hypothetical protein VNI00_010687 [Paramarasmius palmivorus]|uniref:Uncharacterized protein n=1 Tax=Paramarasmius palmivorus TaxID=297713 RepID=A0AAW0CJ68_9AGAR